MSIHRRKAKIMKKIRKRLRKALRLFKVKLPKKLESIRETVFDDYNYHLWLRLPIKNPLVWKIVNGLYNLPGAISRRRSAISKWCRERAEELERRKYCPGSNGKLKVCGPVRRLRYSIHAAIRGEKSEKKIRESLLPESYHYWIEGLRVRGGSVLKIDGQCYNAENGSYIHIANDAGIEFIFETRWDRHIVGDRNAIPEDDYDRILFWLRRHEREISSAWYAYSAPIIEWPEWNPIDCFRSYLEKRQKRERMRAELQLIMAEHRRIREEADARRQANSVSARQNGSI